MIEDLLKLKKQIDCMIETYKDLHPDEEMVIDDIGQMYNPTDVIGEKQVKENALKKIREGTYERTFRKKPGQETTEHGEGPPSLCVFGDS